MTANKKQINYVYLDKTYIKADDCETYIKIANFTTGKVKIKVSRRVKLLAGVLGCSAKYVPEILDAGDMSCNSSSSLPQLQHAQPMPIAPDQFGRWCAWPAGVMPMNAPAAQDERVKEYQSLKESCEEIRKSQLQIVKQQREDARQRQLKQDVEDLVTWRFQELGKNVNEKAEIERKRCDRKECRAHQHDCACLERLHGEQERYDRHVRRPLHDTLLPHLYAQYFPDCDCDSCDALREYKDGLHPHHDIDTRRKRREPQEDKRREKSPVECKRECFCENCKHDKLAEMVAKKCSQTWSSPAPILVPTTTATQHSSDAQEYPKRGHIYTTDGRRIPCEFLNSQVAVPDQAFPLANNHAPGDGKKENLEDRIKRERAEGQLEYERQVLKKDQDDMKRRLASVEHQIQRYLQLYDTGAEPTQVPISRYGRNN